MFKEAIEAFHPKKGHDFYSRIPKTIMGTESQQLYDYLALDFELPGDWNFGDFVIEKSVVYNHTPADVNGNSMPMSFISRVRLPEWVNQMQGQMQGHLFTLGLSSVISFCTGRPIYSLRDSDLVHAEETISLSSFLAHEIESLEETNGLRAYVTSDTGERFEGSVRWVNSRFPLIINIDNDNLRCVFVTTDDSHHITNTQTQNIGFEVADLQVVKRNDVSMLACLHPIIFAGPGATQTSVSTKILEDWKQRIDDTISILHHLNFSAIEDEIDYCKSMQSIRLVQLSHHNQRDDFDLSYTLMVAAIEAIAQIAIPKEKIPKPRDYSIWKKYKNKIPGLFDEYRKLRDYINSKLPKPSLSKKFRTFILEYCPIDDWDIVDESKHSFDIPDNIRSVMETNPNSFTDMQIEEILNNTYDFRSKFIHVGAPMPHTSTGENLTDRFFEKVIDPKGSAKFREWADRRGGNTFTHKE